MCTALGCCWERATRGTSKRRLIGSTSSSGAGGLQKSSSWTLCASRHGQHRSWTTFSLNCTTSSASAPSSACSSCMAWRTTSDMRRRRACAEPWTGSTAACRPATPWSARTPTPARRRPVVPRRGRHSSPAPRRPPRTSACSTRRWASCGLGRRPATGWRAWTRATSAGWATSPAPSPAGPSSWRTCGSAATPAAPPRCAPASRPRRRSRRVPPWTTPRSGTTWSWLWRRASCRRSWPAAALRAESGWSSTRTGRRRGGRPCCTRCCGSTFTRRRR
mmetsp:Transcript_21936/g.55240  ORF Transcript_21936/g.55240 Transcript_21936/m.55240 type:complete len:276 (+) Transcript_21936:653-1480(+)